MQEKPQRPIPETLLDFFHARPGESDTVFLSFEAPQVDLTRREFNHRVRCVASGLRALDLKPGDRVAALLDNGPAIVEAWFATLLIGAIWVPVNTALRGGFLSHVLSDSGAHAVIVESDLMAEVAAVGKDLPDLKHVVVVNDLEHDRGGEHVQALRLVSFDDLRGAAPYQESHVPKPAETCALIYTAGTTGPSKGCMLPHNYVTNLCRYSLFGRRVDEPAFTALPLYHLNAMTTVLITMMIGARATIGRRFSVSGFWPSIEASGARFTNLLGPMAAMLANAPNTDTMKRCKGQLRRVLAAPFPVSVQDIFRDRFGVAEVNGVGYGMTEVAPITYPTVDGKQPAGSSGTRTPVMQVQIVDDDDNEVPVGEIGEIVCRPNFPSIMFSGYWNRPEDTVKAWRNLWFHTGDIGYFDPNGFFYFVDRKKDYIRRRGENISSMEVEGVFQRHPDVAEVAAYGVPSDLGEDEVQVSVVLRDGAAISAQQLCEWSVPHLPHFAVPRYVELRASIPKSAVGRARKVELRSRPPDYPRWDREASDVDVKRRR